MVGPSLDLEKDAAHVFADDAQEHELNASEKQDDRHRRRPALHRVAREQSHSQDVQQVEKAGAGHEETDVDGELEGDDGGRSDAVDGQSHHAAVAVVRGSCGTAGPFVGDLCRRETQIGDEHAEDAVALGQGVEPADHPGRDQPEVADVLGNMHLARQAVDGLVEAPGCPALEKRVVPSRGTPRVDDVEAALPLRQQIGDEFRRVLQVGVHDDDGIAVGAPEPGGQGGLVAEVARQIDDRDARVALACGQQQRQGTVARTVVDRDQTELVVQAVKDREQGIQEQREHGFFVVGRNDHINAFHP